jgi:hypothetical protein
MARLGIAVPSIDAQCRQANAFCRDAPTKGLLSEAFFSDNLKRQAL